MAGVGRLMVKWAEKAPSFTAPIGAHAPPIPCADQRDPPGFPRPGGFAVFIGEFPLFSAGPTVRPTSMHGGPRSGAGATRHRSDGRRCAMPRDCRDSALAITPAAARGHPSPLANSRSRRLRIAVILNGDDQSTEQAPLRASKDPRGCHCRSDWLGLRLAGAVQPSLM